MAAIAYNNDFFMSVSLKMGMPDKVIYEPGEVNSCVYFLIFYGSLLVPIFRDGTRREK